MSDTAATLPPMRPRITGISGLNERRLPLDGTVLPKSLIAWVAAAEGRSAAMAPKIYALPAGGSNGVPATAGSGRTLVAENQTQRDLGTSRRRWRLAKTRAPSHESRPASSAGASHPAGPGVLRSALINRQAPAGDQDIPKMPEQGAPQTLLHTEDLWALANVLMVLKYPDSPLGVVVPHERLPQRAELFFRPGPMIRRMGYALSGDRYAKLEQSLARLAQLRVVEEVYSTTTRTWVAEATEPLLLSLDTGLCRIDRGRADTTSSAHRRHSEWRITPGRPLIQMLNAAASDLMVVPRVFWEAAGSSPSLRYLALDIAQHGFDNRSTIYPSKYATLIEKMRLLDDDAHAHHYQQGQLSLDANAGTGRVQPRDFREHARHAGRSLRRGIRTLDRALARFSQRLGFADIRVQPGAQTDLSPSQRQQGQRSRNDLVQFTRWDGRIESALGVLPREFHGTLRHEVARCNAVLRAARQAEAPAADHLADLAARLLSGFHQVSQFCQCRYRATLQRTSDLIAVALGYANIRFTPATPQPLALTL